MKQWSNEHAKLTIGPSAALPAGMPGVMEVTGVWTDPEHRKQGYATELMKQACDAADVEKVVLMLEPKAFGPDGLKELEAWYERFGFTVIQKKPTVLMARMPQMWQPKISLVGLASQRVAHG